MSGPGSTSDKKNYVHSYQRYPLAKNELEKKIKKNSTHHVKQENKDSAAQLKEEILRRKLGLSLPESKKDLYIKNLQKKLNQRVKYLGIGASGKVIESGFVAQLTNSQIKSVA